METDEGGDDQGSGWLQVKKKHRSSSKFSVHGWVGGFSVKQNSRTPHGQPSLSKLNNGYTGQPLQAKKSNVVSEPGKITESVNVRNEGLIAEDFDPKAQVTHKLPDCHNDNFCSQKDTSDILPKIKWGDLDESTLLLHQRRTVGAEIKFGQIESPKLMCRKSEDADACISCTTSSDQKPYNFTARTVDEDCSLLGSNSLSPTEDSLEINCNKANEASSQDLEVQTTDDIIVDLNGTLSSCNGHPEDEEGKGLRTSGCSEVSEPSNGDGNAKMDASPSNCVTLLPESGDGAIKAHSLPRENISCAALDEAVTIQASANLYEPGSSEVSEIPVLGEDSNMEVLLKDCESLSTDNTGSGVPAEPTNTTSTEDFNFQPGHVVLDDLTKTPLMDHINEGGEESKERFRDRLWCFLFENLNRAVDELYLLCELECDMEQMKEAILVLEEAASDFRELNARVQDFEKVKKSSTYSPDGSSPLTMKSDHRRPHALSWEVRRMTTSPRRAEILSSSLEAFRKIQQERACSCVGSSVGPDCHSGYIRNGTIMEKDNVKIDTINNDGESISKPSKQQFSDIFQGNSSKEEKNVNSNRSASRASRFPVKDCPAAAFTGKNKKDLLGAGCEAEKQLLKKEKVLKENMMDKNSKSLDLHRRHIQFSDREKEKRTANVWKSMDAWKEKRNWEDILAHPNRLSSRSSHSPGLARKSAERARTLHDKLMSPDKKKKSVLDLKKEAEEKHARAMRIRNELESERVQRLQRTSEKLNRVNEFQAERSTRLREDMYARHQKSESRHEAFLAQVVRRANDESSKVNEVRFITSLNEENKKLILRQKLHDSELRRAEKLQLLKSKQKEETAREEAVLERKKLLEAEKLQRITEMQRKKEEAQVRREEERKASSAAREAKAMEQMRRKEVRAKAQQEEAELLAQKLAERLSESEQRRKFYLEQIRERASMDLRDQTSPFLRRSVNKDGQGRSTPNSSSEDCQGNNGTVSGRRVLPANNMAVQHSLKRRIKKIRQKLMALKHEYIEPCVGAEVAGIGYRTTVGTARAKIGRWLQELQKLRQARKEGAASFGLITAEIIKFLGGRDAELQASCQAGLLDFIASALPASHTSKPEACQVTLCLLKLLRVVLTLPANRSYFLSQNLLPPIIPVLAAALENYIKIAASANVPGTSLISKSSVDNLDSISEILDGFLWVVAASVGHGSSNERQQQMQDGLLELLVAYQVIHRLRDLFALYDRPQVEGSPFPLSIILSVKLLTVLTSRFRTVSSIDWESFPCEMISLLGSEDVKVTETGNVKGLPDVPEDRSLDGKLEVERSFGSPPRRNGGLSSEKISDEVEFSSSMTGIVDVKNECNDVTKYSVSLKEDDKSVDKVAYHKDEVGLGLKQPVAYLLSAISETGLVCLPSMLTAVLLQANNKLSSEQARPDLKMEFFHLMSFLLSHCTTKWGTATDQIGSLLLECLSLLGYFSLLHPENQAVLRWGKSPTILHKICDLPFVFFSDPELMPILAGTLVAACFGCEQNKSVILQELSMDMVLSLLKSCRNSSPTAQFISCLANSPPDENGEPNLLLPHETRKLQGDASQSQRSLRSRNARLSQKGGLTSSTKTAKVRSQKENKVSKLSEDMVQKYNQYTSESSGFMLHSRFPASFIERAEHFFSVELTSSCNPDT